MTTLCCYQPFESSFRQFKIVFSPPATQIKIENNSLCIGTENFDLVQFEVAIEGHRFDAYNSGMPDVRFRLCWIGEDDALRMNAKTHHLVDFRLWCAIKGCAESGQCREHNFIVVAFNGVVRHHARHLLNPNLMLLYNVADVEDIEWLILIGRAISGNFINDVHHIRLAVEHLNAVFLIDELHCFCLLIKWNFLVGKTFRVKSNPKMSPFCRKPRVALNFLDLINKLRRRRELCKHKHWERKVDESIKLTRQPVSTRVQLYHQGGSPFSRSK